MGATATSGGAHDTGTQALGMDRCVPSASGRGPGPVAATSAGAARAAGPPRRPATAQREGSAQRKGSAILVLRTSTTADADEDFVSLRRPDVAASSYGGLILGS